MTNKKCSSKTIFDHKRLLPKTFNKNFRQIKFSNKKLTIKIFLPKLIFDKKQFSPIIFDQTNISTKNIYHQNCHDQNKCYQKNFDHKHFRTKKSFEQKSNSTKKNRPIYVSTRKVIRPKSQQKLLPQEEFSNNSLSTKQKFLLKENFRTEKFWSKNISKKLLGE